MSPHRLLRVIVPLLALALATGCPPPEIHSHFGSLVPAPAPIMPVLDEESAAAPPGTVPVVIDVDGDPARVSVVHARLDADATAPPDGRLEDGAMLCVTPCTVHLPPGRFELEFARKPGNVAVDRSEPVPDRGPSVLMVKRDPLLYRHAMPTVGEGNGALFLTGYGLYSAGILGFWVGIIAGIDEPREPLNWTIAASSLLIAWAGVWLYKQGTPVVHPGRSASFPLPLR